MKHVLFFTLLLVHTLAIRAQTVKITGRTLDGKDQTPLAYVAVVVLSADDSTVINGGYSDLDGRFVIGNIPKKSSVFVELNILGFKKAVIGEIKTTMGDEDIGEIRLEPLSTDLETVLVLGDRAEVEMHVDKQVFNAEKMNPSGNTALDLLREIPSLLVDENDQISFRGQLDLTLMVDGRIVNTSLTHFLRSISADQVEKIEVIPNPSAKYDAEGITGIINVILKRRGAKGLNASASIMNGKGTTNRTNAGLDLSMHTNKVNTSFGYFFNDYNSKHNSYTLREIETDLNEYDRLESQGDDLSTSLTHIFRAGVDLFANKNTIYFSGTYNPAKLDKPASVAYKNSDTGQTSLRETDSWGPMNYYDLNFGWQSVIGEKLQVDFDNQFSVIDHVTNEFITEEFEDESYTETKTFGQEITKNLANRLDFETQVMDSTNLEFGAKLDHRTQSAEIELNTFDMNVIQDSSYASRFNFNQTIIAGYFSANRSWESWTLKVGLRAEQTLRESHLAEDNHSFERKYLSLFPSAFLTYKSGTLTTFHLNLSRRIKRPRMQMINPYIYYSDRYLIEQGTPELRPEFSYMAQLGMSRYGSKLGLDVSIYGRYIVDRIRRYLRQEGEVSIISYKNLEPSQAHGLQLAIRYSMAKWLSIRFNNDIWNVRLRDDQITGGLDMSTWGSASNLAISFSFPREWKADMRCDYRPRMELQQGYMKPRYSLSMGVSKSFLSGKMKIRLNASDVFNTMRSHFRTNETQDYYFLGNWKWETRVVYIGMSYDFSSGATAKKKRLSRKDTNEDELPGGF